MHACTAAYVTEADPGLPLGGSISRNAREFLKPRPFFVHIRLSDRATTATDQRSSNLCQGK